MAAGAAKVHLDGFFEHLERCADKQALTHGMHPYPAKYIPHIPRELIRTFALPGKAVLDPMCGSGTTLVEAATLGHEAIGVDINPIAVLVSKAKTARLGKRDMEELDCLRSDVYERSAALSRGAGAIDAMPIPDFTNREKWFTAEAALGVATVLGRVRALRARAARVLAECALSAILVRVSNQESETRWCAKRRQIAAEEVLRLFHARLSKSIVASREYSRRKPKRVVVKCADARRLPVEERSVGMVVFSPPYANAHDYYLYNKLRLFWLGHDVGSVQAAEIGSRHRHSDKQEDADTYLGEMREVLAGSAKALVRGGRVAIVVGDAVIHGVTHDMGAEYSRLARALGLRAVYTTSFSHKRFNSAFQRGFGSKKEKRTRVLVFER